MDVPDRHITPAEYLALEAVSPDRLEYRDGQAVALATPSKNHAIITQTLTQTFGVKARANGCQSFGENAKVLSPTGDRLIPDFVVTCDPRDLTGDLADKGENNIRRPWLVIEVLSPATAADDLTQKFEIYRSIPELTHYVAIDSRRRSVHVYARLNDGSFASRFVERLILPTLGDHGLSLDELYAYTTVPILRNLSPPTSTP